MWESMWKSAWRGLKIFPKRGDMRLWRIVESVGRQACGKPAAGPAKSGKTPLSHRMGRLPDFPQAASRSQSGGKSRRRGGISRGRGNGRAFVRRFPATFAQRQGGKAPCRGEKERRLFPVFPAVGAAGGAGSGFSTVSAGSTASTKKDLILSVLFVSCARTRKQAHAQTSARANKRTREQEKETGHGPSPCPAGQGTGMSHLTFLKTASAGRWLDSWAKNRYVSSYFF